MLPQRDVGDRRGYPHSSRVVHRILWICRHPRRWAGGQPFRNASERPDQRHCHCGTVLAQRRSTEECTVPTNEERIAACDAMRARIATRRRTGPDRPAARPRQADRAGADRAAAGRGLVRRARRVRRRRVVRRRARRRSSATASSPATAGSTVATSSSSARTSRSSADRCPRPTPRRSARSWTSR